MQVRLKDIAEITGVSINTVSRSLRDMPDIGNDTKQRVRQAADRLGYVPNAQAKGLVSKKSYTIGLIATELANPSRAAMVEELRRTASAHDYQLLVWGYGDVSDAGAGIRKMVAQGVDGLFVGNIFGSIAESPCWSEMQWAMNSGVPVVVFFEGHGQSTHQVCIDYEEVLFELTMHLIRSHAHSRIAYLGAAWESGRALGFKRAMTEAGLGDSMLHIPAGGWSTAATKEAIVSYIASGVDYPSAIVCHNDLAAIGAIAGLREVGLNVPEDIAVVGIDNIELAEFLNPTLTTAGCSPAQVAAALFDTFVSATQGELTDLQPHKSKIPMTYFFRESCGCHVKMGARGQ